MNYNNWVIIVLTENDVCGVCNDDVLPKHHHRVIKIIIFYSPVNL